jgi:hypothetical protein
MRKRALIYAAIIGACSLAASAQPAVRVEPAHLEGPRQLAAQTEQGVVSDYLQSWKAMAAALEQNQPGLLDRDFIGNAKDKLTATIRAQAAAGLHTRYVDRSHDLQIVFYSPDGMSIELTDTVDYDVQVFDHDKQIASRPAHGRYIVIMTPAEVSWRIRVFQAQAE